MVPSRLQGVSILVDLLAQAVFPFRVLVALNHLAYVANLAALLELPVVVRYRNPLLLELPNLGFRCTFDVELSGQSAQRPVLVLLPLLLLSFELLEVSHISSLLQVDDAGVLSCRYCLGLFNSFGDFDSGLGLIDEALYVAIVQVHVALLDDVLHLFTVGEHARHLCSNGLALDLGQLAVRSGELRRSKC